MSPIEDEGNEWVEVSFARSEIEAGLIIGRLAEAGIEARSMPSQSAPGAWMTGSEPTWTPATVFVEAARATEARSILEEDQGEIVEVPDFEEDEPEIIARGDTRSGWFWVALVVVISMIVVLLQSTLDFLRI